jgi:hypothetical protein
LIQDRVYATNKPVVFHSALIMGNDNTEFNHVSVRLLFQADCCSQKSQHPESKNPFLIAFRDISSRLRHQS